MKDIFLKLYVLQLSEAEKLNICASANIVSGLTNDPKEAMNYALDYKDSGLNSDTVYAIEQIAKTSPGLPKVHLENV
ncbi:hypothetical protein [Oenococcus sicerae]|uniref:hypothetical protein n=1 Tax=Oenococcus sicerae TaxID=2203724 RepID=UPI0039ED66F9